ncbi:MULTISPECIES: hypothetical protein [unclassified Paenibacillus]|uniref:hypothetical protein n=1 Tax=unclassified Paenibacillus TaxID=185978 RepID=UPI00209FE1D8|nr:hypothetical protein [Paenibacillus sp. 1781tsa1]MCP1186036.1 hypothetical protein [Paenibacillus sp. 1781tsa1]
MNQLRYDITRYLCAAAEISPRFRTKVFKQIIDSSVRFVAPSYGVDVPLVARHCLKGQIRDFIVEAALSVLLIWSLISSLNSFGVLFGIFQFVLSLFTYPWLMAILLRWSNLYIGYQIVTKDLKKIQNSDSNKSLIELQYEKRINELEKLQDGNVVYYSGYNPFVGSGIRVDGWSFVCSIEKKGEAQTQEDIISLCDLYEYVDGNMKSLQIPKLTVKDMLYVKGSEVRGDIRFLPDVHLTPISVVPDSLLNEYKEKQEENVRYFQTVQVVGWQGNVIFSSFFRVSKNDKHLFVEANYYALPPLKSEFYLIDELNSPIKLGSILKMGFSSILPAIVLLPLSPIRAYKSGMAFFAGVKDKKALIKQVDENQKFDYGASESIREMAASDRLQNFFQKSDLDMYRKQIERCFTDSVIDYLEEQGVDISEFVQRKESIVNQGITINGGEIHGDVVSVGSQTNKIINQAKNVLQKSSI